MSDTTTVSPLRQRMIEDMAARKLNPHTQRSHIQRWIISILLVNRSLKQLVSISFSSIRGQERVSH
jgi:hypothetical protein